MISTYVHLINQYGPLFPHLSTLLTSMNHDFLIKSYEIPMKSGRPRRFYRRGDLLGAQLTAVRLGSGACVADVALGVDSWMRKVPGWDGSGLIIVTMVY